LDLLLLLVLDCILEDSIAEDDIDVDVDFFPDSFDIFL
jgi:hypothetical protein